MKKFFAFIVLFSVSSAFGAIVKYDASALGTNIVKESFEEAPNYTNATQSSDTVFPNSMVLPGWKTSYTFTQSNVRLTSPIPNIEGAFLPQIMIVYATRVPLDFGAYGTASASKVPDGTHYLVQYGSSAEQLPAFTIGWDYKNVDKIALNPIMFANNADPNNMIEIAPFGLSGQDLGSVLFPATTTLDWKNNTNVLGTNNGEFIAGFTIRTKNGVVDTTNVSNIGFDNLQLNLFTPVPEPATIVGIIGAGAVGVGIFLLRKFRRKKPQINSDEEYYS